MDGTWKKPSYRFCSSPQPKFGGICPEDENGITNVTAVECTNPSKFCLNWLKNQYFECFGLNSGKGKWGPYGNWSECAENCRMYQYRECINPDKAFGGRNCIGLDRRGQFCTTDKCESK